MTSNKKLENTENFADDAFAMNKYSRQVGEYGVEAMSKLIKMKVLVIGLKGVGIEAAKNLILAGVGSVTLYDDDPVLIKDLGTNFYLKPSHVKSKLSVAKACLDNLKSLNPLVNVQLHEGKLTNKNIAQFHIVVDCGLTGQQALLCNRECRKLKPPVKFIRANCYGLVGFCFVDFLDEFIVKDKTGEQPISRILEKVEYDAENKEIILRILTEGKRHNIQDDDHEGWIKLDEIEGELGTYLNSTEKSPKVFRVKMNDRLNSAGKKVFDPYSLRIPFDFGKDKEMPKYIDGGIITQVKKPQAMKFSELGSSLLNPVHPDEGMLMFTDGAKFGRAEQLHIGLNGLWKYEAAHKGLPPVNDDEAVKEVLMFAKEFNEQMKTDKDFLSVEELDTESISLLARFADTKFQPMCCFFGGVVAQEVVKLTGRYTPLHQWLHLDCFEVLPEKFVDEKNPAVYKVTKKDRQPIGSRYDDVIQIIGKPLHEKLMSSSTFMVGCGALGCEMLKNFALIGLSCDSQKKGLITVTDNDRIEISNLSRQFLFREENVGQSKSLAAAESVAKMNSDIHVKAMESLVSPASEHIFNANFWESLDFVTNALDNVTARVYVDGQCVLYEKPLLESGTLGTKCNSQVIVPFLTQSYADGPVSELEDAIPMCTLRNFPSIIEHCIEWARAEFTDFFETESTKASNFLNNPKEYIKGLKEKTIGQESHRILNAVHIEFPSLKKVYDILLVASSSKADFETCLEEAYIKFHRYFRDKIISLIETHPENSLDRDGNPFWISPKRFPLIAKFDANNPTHLGFVIATANILANIYGVSGDKSKWKNETYVRQVLQQFSPPEVVIEKVDESDDATGNSTQVEVIDSDVKEERTDGNPLSDPVVKQFRKILDEMEKMVADGAFNNVHVEAASFEKDDDSNYHIDFITAASNMRAWNYKLKEISRHKCKMIAGKIVPALATTTAAVTGLVTIELLKLIQPGKVLEAFKETGNSMGNNHYLFSEPSKPAEAKDEFDVTTLEEVVCLPPKFTKWDKTFIAGKNLTLAEFLDRFNQFGKEKYGKDIEISLLLHSSADEKNSKGYSKFLYAKGDDKYAEFLDQDLKELIVKIYGDVLAKTYVWLDCNVVGKEDGQFYKVPRLIYKFA